MANNIKKTPSGTPSLPIEDLLVNVARGIAGAQGAMDEHALSTEVLIRNEGLDKKFGLSAHWFTIPELNFDLRLALEVDESGEVKSKMVDAEYKSKYGFDLEASSLIKTKILAVPPNEVSGISLLEAEDVKKIAGQIKKIVEAYSRSDTPHFVAEYQPFAKQGYAGGLWYVKLVDRLPEGRSELRALCVIDDSSGNIMGLWTDAPITISGVTFTSAQSIEALGIVNSATAEELEDEVGIHNAGVDLIVEKRPFDSLITLEAVLGVGDISMTKIHNYVTKDNE